MNFVKPDSLYNQGMKILCYHLQGSEKCNKTPWKREGTNIAYFKNSIQKLIGSFYYTLTFTLTAGSQEMYVASDHPYAYSDLCNLIKEICTDKTQDRVKDSVLCKTIAGNPCFMLTITNFITAKEEIDKRPTIIFTGRVHPG